MKAKNENIYTCKIEITYSALDKFTAKEKFIKDLKNGHYTTAFITVKNGKVKNV